jgi:arylsulfatase A-like enzyme
VHRRDFVLGAIAGVGALGAAGVVIGSAANQSSSSGNDAPPATPAPAPGATLPTQGSGDVRRYGDQEYRQGTAPAGAPNIIFISLDDQNDWMGFLEDHPGTKTPRLDAFAAESANFTNAYAPAPMCLPSRTAMLFGRSPHETRVYDHDTESQRTWQEFTKDVPSLLDDFWVAGYDVRGVGKIFNYEDANRWSTYARTVQWIPGPDRDGPEAPTTGYRPDWVSPYDGQPVGTGERYVPGDIDFGPTGVPIAEDPTMEATAWARQQLQGQFDRPFFLALGLGAMHDPWRVPQEFLDQHPLDQVVTPEDRPEDLEDLPTYAREEIVDQLGSFARLKGSGQWPAAVQACQAATTFADHCVGLLLDDLAASPYADNTIVVVFSDNGFHLGEKQHLHKFTLWEPSTHVPLLIKAPSGISAGVVEQPVSLMDVGPTLHELAGIEGLYAEHEGQSLLRVVDDPAAAVDHPPVMTWRSGNHAVRQEQWRYIRYRDGGTELYDISADPDEYENLSGQADLAEIEARLDALLPAPS